MSKAVLWYDGTLKADALGLPQTLLQIRHAAYLAAEADFTDGDELIAHGAVQKRRHHAQTDGKVAGGIPQGDAADLTGADMPSPSAYLSAQQKNGKPLGADIVYKETWLWLKQRGCEKHVNKRLLESYSQAFARFVQCEEALSTYGLLGKHPTTGGVIASPFVQMSQTFQKQANLLWYEIFDIVKQNCTTKFDGTPQDDLMEQLLSSRK